MICPHCKKETASIYRICQNCKADLEEYRDARNEAIEGTGEYDYGTDTFLDSIMKPFFLFKDYFEPVGGLILMVLGVILTYLLFFHRIYPHHLGYSDIWAPLLFFAGLIGFIEGIKRMKKRHALKGKKKKGDIID